MTYTILNSKSHVKLIEMKNILLAFCLISGMGCALAPNQAACRAQFNTYDTRAASLVVDTSTETTVRAQMPNAALGGTRTNTGAKEIHLEVRDGGSSGAYCGTYIAVIRTNGLMSCIQKIEQFIPNSAPTYQCFPSGTDPDTVCGAQRITVSTCPN